MFAHLHVHSHFSLLESCIRINELVDAAASLDMKAIALTDKYAMNGTVEFCKLAKARGIKPITGCEVCLMHPDDSLNLSHLTLLAIDGKGYKNLCSLVTKSHTRDKKNTMHPALPYIIMNELEKFCDGIICLSGCSKGWLGALLKANSFDRAKLFAKKLYDIFGQNFYVEIQRYSLEFPAYHPNLNPASEMLAAFSNKFKIPAVATNNVHYLSPADYKTYRYMTKIKMMGTKNDPLFNIIENQELYLKSIPQMAALFRDIPGAIVNTQHIADKCNFDFRHDSLCLPCFETPYGQSQQDYLEKICIEGLKSRFGNNPPDTARKRLAKELNAIKTAGFAGYFLVVADMARFAHENNIPVCGKGSAAGSLISYILKISNVDPIENNLYFERFLNEGRKKPPDIDIDVSSKDRPRIWEYLKSKYGTGCVSRVASFSTTKPRSSIRESGRILNAAKEEIDSIIKAAPGYNRFFTENKMNRVLEKSNLLDLNSPEVKRILSVSKKISGYIRHISMHPSAFIVSNSNLSEKIPMTFSEDKELMSQYDMNSIEDLGILKIDLINSLSLDLICNVLKQIEKTRNISLDMQKIQYSDTGVFKMIQSGDTLGVFQLESFGIRTLARKIKPCCLNDITLLISLYRPGPQQSGMVDKFIERKFKREAVTYMHKDLEPILRETFGVILYQEQAMQVAMKIAGYSLSEADELRKAISDL